MRYVSAYARHSVFTGHSAHTRLATSTPTPSEGKNSVGDSVRQRAWSIHAGVWWSGEGRESSTASSTAAGSTGFPVTAHTLVKAIAPVWARRKRRATWLKEIDPATDPARGGRIGAGDARASGRGADLGVRARDPRSCVWPDRSGVAAVGFRLGERTSDPALDARREVVHDDDHH